MRYTITVVIEMKLVPAYGGFGLTEKQNEEIFLVDGCLS